MGYFARQLDAYATRYRLSRADRLRVALRWPLFKLFYWARSGPPRLRAVTMPVFRLFGAHTVMHVLRARDGRGVPFALRFDEFDFATFREILWGDEYDAPFDLGMARSLVDLGANTGIGVVRFLLAAPLERIVAVEANPALLPALGARLAEQVRDGTALVEHAAIVGRPDAVSVRFNVADNPRHGSTAQVAGARPVEVPAITLRGLLDKHGLERVDICKIDIEGGEHDLLDRDPDVFGRIGALFVEVHGEQTRRDGFVERLRETGFEIARRSAEPGALSESVVARRSGP